MTWPLPRVLPARDRQARLHAAVGKLADAIAAGEVTPLEVELEALALLCEEQYLLLDAARVRRWMTPCGSR